MSSVDHIYLLVARPCKGSQPQTLIALTKTSPLLASHRDQMPCSGIEYDDMSISNRSQSHNGSKYVPVSGSPSCAGAA